VIYPIYTFGSDARKNKRLPLLQQRKAIGCFGLTEPQFGSNPGGMLTRAVIVARFPALLKSRNRANS
jgi:glutaryl-CoA dehydrogenase